MIDSLVILIICLFKVILSNEIHIIKRVGVKYDRGIGRTVRTLEKVMIEFNKAKHDYEFLHMCLIYHLLPKFTRFKLCNKKYTKDHVYH